MEALNKIGFILLSIIFSFIVNGAVGQELEIKQQNHRNDSWQIIGPGGGGAMFNQSVSPHDNKVVFVSCDMGGSYVSYNGGLSWRMFNLPTMTKSYTFDPNDENVIYAISLGIFKSIDKGKTWKIIYPESKDINKLISKGDHANLLISTNDSTTRKVMALSIDPVVSSSLYAVISIDNITGFYSSDDGGIHWKFEKQLNYEATNIFIDPSSPKKERSIYLAGKSGIEQRVSGQWLYNKLPDGVGSITAYSGGYDTSQKKQIIYGISGKSYFNTQGDKSGIFYTSDGGRTWENRQEGLLSLGVKSDELPEWRAIATSAMHPEVVYVSYSNLKIGNNSSAIGVAKSTDFGKTWNLVWKDLFSKGTQISSDNFRRDWLNDRWGPGWSENPFSIGVAPSNPDICFTGDFGRTVKTEDGGKTWETVNSEYINGDCWTTRGLDVTTNYTVVFDPFDVKHIYIPTTDVGLLESNDATQTWKSATKNNGIPEKWVNTCYWLTFDQEVKGKAWAVMSDTHDLPRPKMFRKNGVTHFKGGILMTENNGKTWTTVSSDIGESAMTHIIYDPQSPKENRTMYACAFGRGVYKSVDGGKTWNQKNFGIAGKEPFAWQISRRESDGALFLVVSRRSDDGSIGNEKDGALYLSVDNAETWQKIELPKGTNAPTSITFGNSDEIILSAWGVVSKGRFSADTGGGIFKSTNNGNTWYQVLSADQHIGAVTFDKRTNRFYACGFNSSAYYSEDNGNSWQRIKGYNFKWGQRVEPDPRNPEKIFINTFGGGVWFGPAKGDQQSVEDIVPSLY
ncbi:MAG: hypothetical protein JNK09_21675 [Prolixibacteraceae bacterium]|nr:hypothetical protein [Prolixibacteraceae bacterium]